MYPRSSLGHFRGIHFFSMKNDYICPSLPSGRMLYVYICPHIWHEYPFQTDFVDLSGPQEINK